MRVHLRTKRIKATTFACNRCSEPIKVGEKYYEWKHNHAPVSRRHVQHGAPKQSELCTGKMSGVYAATEALEEAITSARNSNDASGLEDALNECASSVREVGDEYSSNIDNMPESLQNGSTAEDMREKAEALEAFAEALENAAQEIDLEGCDEEEPEVMEDHTDACAMQAIIDEKGEADSDTCDCGYEEKFEAHETWENDRDEKIEEACTVAENALQELSI